MINISEKGSMHWLAALYAGFDQEPVSTNLCPFVRQVLAGVVMSIVLTLVGVLLGLVVIDTVATDIMFLSTGNYVSFLSDPLNVIGNVILAVVSLILVAAYLTSLSARGKFDFIANSKPVTGTAGSRQLLAAWFTAMHDKVCPSINIVD
jgi:hypothetical protein